MVLLRIGFTILLLQIVYVASQDPVPDGFEIPGLNDPDPTAAPTVKPSPNPTAKPSPQPSAKPTHIPTVSPSAKPTASPTDHPSTVLTLSPSHPPTSTPTLKPSKSPLTLAPTKPNETRAPSTIPTLQPTKQPTLPPTNKPSSSPTPEPSSPPTRNPSPSPTETPSKPPSASPTLLISTIMTQETEIIEFDSAANGKRTGNKPTNETASIAIPIQAVSLLIVLSLFIVTLYHFNLCCTKPSDVHAPDDIIVSIKVPVLLTFLSNIAGITCCCAISYILTSAIKYDHETYNKAVIAYYTLTCVYCLGKFCLETFFLMRLYHAFSGSTFALRGCTVIALCIWMLCVSCFWCYLFAADDQSIFGVNFILFVVLEAVEASLIIMLLYLFIIRLYRLVLKQTFDASKAVKHGAVPSRSVASVTSTASQSHTVDLHKTRTRMKLTRVQTNLIFLITRCILLSAISLFTTAGFTLFVFYFVKWRATNMLVLYTWWSVDMATNCACLFLNFRFTDALYKKCCGFCHKACQKAMEYRTAERMMTDTLVVQQQSISSMDTNGQNNLN